jgi:DNA-binding NtrC family response regulator
LRNVLERAVLLSEQHVLGAEGGNVERAARRLRILRSSLYQKIKRYGLAPRPKSGIRV